MAAGSQRGDAECVVIVTREEYNVVRLVLDFVDRLCAEDGSDPSTLLRAGTQEPFGPFIDRLRTGIELFEEFPPDAAHHARDGASQRRRLGVA